MMRCPGQAGVVITMAGAGSRFAHAGYDKPKYEIEVHGRTLFSWSMRSLRAFIDEGCRFVFVARNTAGINAFIRSQCEEIGIRSNELLLLDTVTDGQATTALVAQSVWDDMDRPLAIYNIDTYVSPAALSVSTIRGNGWLPCFPGEGDKWSFAAADPAGRVSEVREKKRISSNATVGLYWFDSFRRYADAYQRYYSTPGHLDAHERYIAPLYNQLIADHAEVFLHQLQADDVCALGTPEDVALFRDRPKPGAPVVASEQ
jgi:hypothetical protein